MKNDQMFIVLEPRTGKVDGPFPGEKVARWGKEELLAYWDNMRPRHEHVLLQIIEGGFPHPLPKTRTLEELL